jgi:hypothetical protein
MKPLRFRSPSPQELQMAVDKPKKQTTGEQADRDRRGQNLPTPAMNVI